MENNVVILKEYSVAEDVQDFIKGLETENTKKRYMESIKKFTEWKWQKPLEFVSIEEVNKLTYTDFKKFRDSMRRKYSPGTVNNTMIAIYSLLKELKRVQNEETKEYVYEIEDIDKLRVKSLRNKNVNHSGYLTWEQVDEWIEYLEDSKESNKDKKIAFLKLARLTGLRKQAIVDLKFSDIRKEDDSYVIHSYIKGKKHRIPVPDHIASMLFDLKRLGDTKTSKVIGLSGKTLDRLIDMLKKEFNIEEEQNITVHSLRNLAAWEAYLSSGKNLLAVQQLLGHDQLETTYIYIKNREALETSPTLHVREEISGNCIEGLSRDEILQVFNELSRSAKYEFVNKAIELGLLDQ